MYIISRMFHFEASHQLTGLPDGHKCARLHGHSYRVKLTLGAEHVDTHGFVIDYGDLKPFGDYIASTLDHRHLNAIVAQPTAENLAKHLYEVAIIYWPTIDRLQVGVSETEKTWAFYDYICY